MARSIFPVRTQLFACIFFFISPCFFTVPLQASTSESNNLTKRIQLLLQSPSLKKASCGVNVLSLKKNTPLFSYHDKESFAIASNMKLLTTSAALDYLGPDFEYNTSIKTNGQVTSSGELRGDIYIVGSGDPNLSGRFYNGNVTAVPESWADALKKRGVSVIMGDIIADDRIFDRNYINQNWPENQLSEWYCAPSCGLSFNDNCVDITIIPSKEPGKVVSLRVEPDTSYFSVSNSCTYTPNKKEHAYSIYRKPGTNLIIVKGKFWMNAFPEKTWVTVQTPSLYLATVFKEILERNGISLRGNVRLVNEDIEALPALETIAHTTSTMEQTINVTNKHSQNFYAEQILRTLGAHVRGEGTLEAGISVLQDFLRKLGFQPGEYQIEDGSGLSKGNRLSPRILTTLLAYMNRSPHGKALYDSLPISGVDGSLHRRMVLPRYKNKIRAKTGYIARVSALSGYIDTASGDVLVFSILMNNFKDLGAARKIQDNICQAIVDCYH